MKFCRKCDSLKEEIEFGNDVNKKDGLNSYCRVCVRNISSLKRKSNPEYFKKYAEGYREKNREILRNKSRISYYVDWEKRSEQSKRFYESRRDEIAKKRAEKRKNFEEREKNRLRQAAWRRENKSKVAEVVSEWKKRNPQKSAAHTLVLWAIRTGVLKRSKFCEECGLIGKVEGHHEDYLKPLELNWLCKLCHSKKHRVYR